MYVHKKQIIVYKYNIYVFFFSVNAVDFLRCNAGAHLLLNIKEAHIHLSNEAWWSPLAEINKIHKCNGNYYNRP